MVGLRKSELEIGDSWGVYNSYSLLYDRRYRKRAIDEYECSHLLGMVVVEQVWGDHCIRNNAFYKMDPYEQMITICEYYFSMPSKYIASTDDTLFELNRESFKYWLGRVTNRIRFGSLTVLHSLKSIVSFCENNWIQERNPTTKQLLKNYIRLPQEVVMSSASEYKFGFPVTENKWASERLDEKWLHLMTWVKIFNTKLHPTLCRLRENVEKNLSRDLSKEKVSTLLFELQSSYDICNELKASSNINLYNFLHNEHEKLIKEKLHLPRLKVSGEKSKYFFKYVLTTSLDITSSVICYLSDIHKRDEENCFDILLAKSKACVMDFHNSIKDIFKNKYICSHFEEEKCNESLIKSIENSILLHNRRKFDISTTFEENHEIRLKILVRIYKFLRKVTEDVSFSLIQTTYEYYQPPLKKVYSKRLIMNLLLHIIWTSMNVVLSKKFLSEMDNLVSLEYYAKPLDISAAEIILGRTVLLQCIRKICGEIQVCEIKTFKLSPEIIREITVPMSYVYNDFPQYLQAFPGVGRSNQSLLDFDSLTEGTLKRFMTELVICLHFNINTMEEVLGHAREYLKYFQQKKLKNKIFTV